MAGEWQEVTVSEVAASIRNALVGGPFGSNLVSADYVSSGIPVIRGQNMGSRWIGGEFVFVTEAKAKSLEANLARPGDLVFTQRGTLGQVALVPSEPYSAYLVSQSQMKLTVDGGKADPLFLYYVFNSQAQQDYIRQHAIQTGVPHTNLGILRDTPISLPPIETQQSIARVLGTLDDKIELNRRRNETLEGIARALFKSWFVEFDPVRAKAEGRPTGLPKKVEDLFPDSLAPTDQGNVPQRWQLKPIGELAGVSGGSTPSTKELSYWEGGTHYWATPKDLSALRTPVLLETERKITDAGLAQISSGLLPKGTVLMSSRAPIGYLAIAEVPVAINQGFIAMQAAPGVSNLFLLRWAEWAHDLIISRANGSTFLEISKSSFRPILVVTPPEPVMEEFNRMVRPLYERMVCNEFSSKTLSQIRDTLLPKLISGEFRIPDAERIVGGQL